MKTILKKGIGFFIISILLVSSVRAQDQSQDPITARSRKSPTERADEFIKQNQERLKLTSDQSSKLKNLLIQMDANKNMEMNQRKEERRKTEGELSRILNAEQMQEFRQIREERRAKMDERRKQMHQE